jgi:alpha-L-rhamnosidase
MRKYKFLLAVLQLISVIAIAQLSTKNLLTENKSNPIGIDNLSPRFSWQIFSTNRNIKQTAYEIKIVAVTKNKLNHWSSGKISSNQSVQVNYTGPALVSNTQYQWQVRVWDQSNAAAEWSAIASFQTGFLSATDWKAKWISPGYTEDSVLRPSPLFRKSFASKAKIQSATLYITAHGLYEAQINGKRVGDAYLTPGWTAYQKRTQYQTYDVTNMLNTGKNAIGVTLGSGWYRGSLAWANNRNSYGKDISLLAQLMILYEDGSTAMIVTDSSWKSSTGTIQYSEIYHGETVDARLEKKGWTLPEYNDMGWFGVSLGNQVFNTLIATENESVKKQEIFQPIKIFTTPKGEQVIDFGQNLVGWVIVKATGKAGDKITVSHAEVLDKEGNFYTENLRVAKCQNNYILKGEGTEIFEPHFSWQGFRYAKIEGYPGKLTAENFSAVALYSSMPKTGIFESSNALINQLQHNIQWGQNGNFLDVPTDCPQRDERLGWTGDAQAFSRTAAFNRNVNSFFAKWLKDLAADQLPNGSVPHVIPNILGANSAGSAGWADVSTIIPWNMYLAYGDKRILAEQYNSMKAWVGYMEKESWNNLWNTGSHFGDWLFYRPFDDNDGRSAVTDKYLIAQCFFAHSTQLVINAAKVLGKTEDIVVYEKLLKNVKDAFMKEYVSPNGRLVSSTQTAYVLALQFDMLPESMRYLAADKLVGNIKKYNNHLTTGFLGTPYLCEVLTRFGHADLAYTLLLQESYPSWLYPVKMGATTIWERWNGIRTDGSFEPASMNSFNHYAYGAIGDWMYRFMVGLDTYQDGVGYQHIKIQPHIGGGFSYASASLETYYGQVSAGWKVSGTNLELNANIPANTSATVFIPAFSLENITENGKPLDADWKPTNLCNGYFSIELGSGNFQFIIKQ